MNKVEAVMLIITIGIVLAVGVFIYYDMVSELAEHPEIKEIGPPGITNLGPMAALIVVSVIVIGIILWLSPVDENDKKQP